MNFHSTYQLTAFKNFASDPMQSAHFRVKVKKQGGETMLLARLNSIAVGWNQLLPGSLH